MNVMAKDSTDESSHTRARTSSERESDTMSSQQLAVCTMVRRFYVECFFFTFFVVHSFVRSFVCRNIIFLCILRFTNDWCSVSSSYIQYMYSDRANCVVREEKTSSHPKPLRVAFAYTSNVCVQRSL